jgi:hypothetical protein
MSRKSARQNGSALARFARSQPPAEEAVMDRDEFEVSF